MPIKAITWPIVAFAAAAFTAAVLVCSRHEKELRLDRILWVYAGAFTAIAVTWGIVEILLSGGYGTGDIF